MGATTGIEWTDATWNPVTGCTEVSPGCDHCYAKTFAERWRGVPGHHFERGFDVVLRPERLDQPLRWRKPRRVFVNSMSDLFHDDIPDDFIAKVFAVMALAHEHTFQVLTKRHGRMRSLLSGDFRAQVAEEMTDLIASGTKLNGAPIVLDRDGDPARGAVRAPGNIWGPEIWPLPNVWLGVSVENQQWADIRIPALLKTPAAVRFLSMEPLLGPVSFRWAKWAPLIDANHLDSLAGVDWVIVGGESGRGARPMDIAWVRALRDECVEAGVSFFYKQQGSGDGGSKARRELDGRTWDEFPEAEREG